MRLFVAVNIPEDLREKILAIQEKLKKTIPDVKWVAVDKLHITLKFLGDVPRETVPEIIAVLESSVRDFKPFEVAITVDGDFPSASHPRVVWADVTVGRERLANLAGAVESGMEGLELQKEDRSFSPHLTLGRLHPKQGVSALSRKAIQLENETAGSFTVNSVELMESVLDPKGAQYTCLRSISI